MAISIENGRLIGVFRRRIGVKVAAIAGVLGVSLAGVASSAAALPPGCVQAGVTVLCPFVSSGSEQQFVVPPGVFSIGVSAVGGKGGAGATNSGSGGTGGAGAFGAVVIGQLAVTPGRVLYLEVAGNGHSAPDTGTAGAGGFNGGGGGVTIGGSAASGGGGGASDLRTCPRASLSCTLGTSSDPRLLLAAGGGGGGAGLNGNGGAGGAAGPVPATGAAGATAVGGGGAGGGGGSIAVGGAGGAGGSPFLVPPSSGTDGSAGQGGSGSAATGFTQAGGGGGGGGWYGGGGGGSGAFSSSGSVGGGGGGGAGDSFASPGATVTQDSTGTPAIIISYFAPTQAAVVSPASLSFGTQPQSTISAPKTVTITNSGAAALLVTGVTFAGSAPQDYLVAFNGCLGPVAPAASCAVGVSFAPQTQGSSTASLQIASSDPGGPATVSLSGTGGPLAQGPPGQTGQRGPQGPAGQVELVVCRTVTKTVLSHGRKHKVTRQQCSTKLVSGPVKFVTNGGSSSATVARGGITYATGRAVRMSAGRWELVLTRHIHKLVPGRYTLTTRQGRKRIVHRTTITIT
jgi:hypothetical protein